MHKLESIQKNESHKIISDFEIETANPIQVRRLDSVLINNRKKITSYQVDFPIPTDLKVKIKESKKIHKYLDLAKELEK